MSSTDIGYWQLAAGYSLLLLPLSIFLWHKVPLLGEMVISIVRMTVQLLFIGFYLQILFEWNRTWLNILWIAVMVLVADGSIIRGCGLQARRFMISLFIALFLGVMVPLVIFLTVIMFPHPALDARYVIPISGMILGNCLRADIVGIQHFYESIRRREKEFLFRLGAGARLLEAIDPHVRESLQAALNPTIATMATMGVVSLPGMMTGAIMGGADPATAIKYQIAIMIAIFSGTSITVTLAIYLTLGKSFSPWGILDKSIFKEKK